MMFKSKLTDSKTWDGSMENKTVVLKYAPHHIKWFLTDNVVFTVKNMYKKLVVVNVHFSCKFL